MCWPSGRTRHYPTVPPGQPAPRSWCAARSRGTGPGPPVTHQVAPFRVAACRYSAGIRSTTIARKGASSLPGLSCPLCRLVLPRPPTVPAKGGGGGFGGWVPVGHRPGERRYRSARSGPVVSVPLPKGVYVYLRASWVIPRTAVELRPRPRTVRPGSRVSRRRHPGSGARRVHPTREHHAVHNALDPLATAADPRISPGSRALPCGTHPGLVAPALYAAWLGQSPLCQAGLRAASRAAVAFFGRHQSPPVTLSACRLV